jgi:heptosyltransferase III
MSKKAKIALVSFDSLGDSLIYLMISENLLLNGYDVTHYGTVAFELRKWLPHFAIKDYPLDSLEDELDAYDLVIMSPPQAIRNQMDAAMTAEMRERWVLICQKAPQSWSFDITDKLKRVLPAPIFMQVSKFSKLGGSIRFREFKSESVVEIVLAFMKEKMLLENVTKHVNLVPPKDLIYRKYQNRVVISPDSSTPKKNWSPESFIRLCYKLKLEGYKPVIVVSPQNHLFWFDLAGKEFDVPKFNCISELTAFIYESSAVIANDSGNGHLASFLSIPVVTIYRKRNPKFHWRPDWYPAKVVCPWMTLSWRGHSIWKPFVTVGAVMLALKVAVNTNNYQ